MFGFLLGTACLVGLFYMLRGRRWHGRGYCGRSPLYAAFEHLDTSPGQEKVIREAVDDLFAKGRDLKEEFRRSRRDFAAALRSDVLDESSLDQQFERQQASLGEFRSHFVAGMRRIHETLDERQRRRLADWLESTWGSGPGFRRHGPYRGTA